jgi:WD40 repeat protein
MADVDEVLVGVSRAQLEAKLAAAVAAINRGGRDRLLAWPPADLGEFLDALGSSAEGYRQWAGGDDQTARRPRGQPRVVRSVLGVAWWTDRAGRKHVRVGARRGRIPSAELAHLLWPRPGPTGRPTPGWAPPALAVVHPDHTFLRVRGGEERVVATCACGVGGEPDAVGWMGECCGPCHDRRQAGEPAPPPAARSFVLRAEGAPRALCFVPDGRTLAVGVGDSVELWDVHEGRKRVSLPQESSVQGIAVAADGSALAAASSGVSVWRGVPDEPRPADYAFLPGSRSVALSPDGSLVASGLRARMEVRLWRLGESPADPGRELWPGAFAPHLSFSPDGGTLAAGLYGAGAGKRASWQVRLWDVAAEREGAPALEVGRVVTGLCFSPDGRTLAVATHTQGAGVSGEVELWDARGGGRKCVLGPHPGGGVAGVAFLPGGGRMLSAGAGDQVVKLWDLASGREEAAFVWHREPVRGLALSPDGSWLATAERGLVRLWPVELLCGG